MNAHNQLSNECNSNKKKKIKALVIALCLVTAITVAASSLLAYFSDVYSGSTEMAAGTLSLEGTARFYINDSTMQNEADEKDLECINPGDTVIAVIEVTNQGSKSAWIKSSFTLSAAGLTGTQLSNAFTVYEGATASGTPLSVDSTTGSVSFSDSGSAILNGTYETEDGVPGAIKDTTTTMIFTIVFESSAGNVYQGAEISVGYEVKALQYRNNETNPNWDLAVAISPTGP